MASVLVVEDEGVLLEMLAALVEESGHHPIMATNGQEALNVLQNTQELPALIISDIMMPQMNGIALAHAVHSDPRLHHLPLILMSAAGTPPPAIANHFIAKPFNIDDLEGLILRYVTG
ncbi:MAG: response regulator [Herpetosiphonaceae bacterium]|nr:response regulator [Herpetosiphonaceae bacterium]